MRDDKEGIAFPNIWTCTPGGHVEDGENIFGAMVRELKEEFGIRVTDMKLFKTRTEAAGEMAGLYHFFTAKLESLIEDIRCFEGQKAVLFSVQEVLALKLHPLSRQALEDYRKSGQL